MEKYFIFKILENGNVVRLGKYPCYDSSFAIVHRFSGLQVDEILSKPNMTLEIMELRNIFEVNIMYEIMCRTYNLSNFIEEALVDIKISNKEWIKVENDYLKKIDYCNKYLDNNALKEVGLPTRDEYIEDISKIHSLDDKIKENKIILKVLECIKNDDYVIREKEVVFKIDVSLSKEVSFKYNGIEFNFKANHEIIMNKFMVTVIKQYVYDVIYQIRKILNDALFNRQFKFIASDVDFKNINKLLDDYKDMVDRKQCFYDTQLALLERFKDFKLNKSTEENELYAVIDDVKDSNDILSVCISNNRNIFYRNEGGRYYILEEDYKHTMEKIDSVIEAFKKLKQQEDDKYNILLNNVKEYIGDNAKEFPRR